MACLDIVKRSEDGDLPILQSHRKHPEAGFYCRKRAWGNRHSR